RDVSIPLLGVVERAASRSVLEAILLMLVEEKVIPAGTRHKVRRIVKDLNLHDELLFGCVLEAGEYITPLSITKNKPHRAHDRWRPLMSQIPAVTGTMLKVTEHSFPFRIEMNSAFPDDRTFDVLRLIYHTSLLLPKYAFPVGIDIVDKY